MTKHINIKISGKVQGVGFRFSAYEKFVELGLQGHAHNGADRNVILDVEGPEEKLAPLIEWCRQGPTGSKVENVEVSDAEGPFVPLKMG